MIVYLKGKIIYKEENFVILKRKGVGYLIYLSKALFKKVKLGEEKEFFVYEFFKEEKREFYGFKSFEELKFFKVLISVSRIGPKSALEILENIPLEKLKEAVLNQDLTLLTEVYKIGEKRAERILLELKDKLKLDQKESKKKRNVFEALKSLGYTSQEIKRVLEKISPKLEEKEMVKEALKQLGKKNA